VKGIAAILGVGLAGVFVGALAMELIHRTRPNLVKDLEDSARKGLGAIGDAFKKGYHGGRMEEDRLEGGA